MYQQRVKEPSGFFFYEDYEGYKFKSVDRMVDATQVEYPSDAKELYGKYGIPTYTLSTVIQANDPNSEFQILHAFREQSNRFTEKFKGWSLQ